MTNGPIKRSKSHKSLQPSAKKKRKYKYTKKDANKADLKNMQYKAERDYAFAEPNSPAELRAKIRFKQATKMLKKYHGKK